MAVSIKISNFEGPFDLLLHLIKKNKMDIYDIQIYQITNQYIQYIEKMKDMDLEVTSEFILTAAMLLEIKSKTLLPKFREDNKEEDEDPRKELIQKLLDYNKFKSIAEKLNEMQQGSMFSKKPEIIDDVSTNKFDFKDVNLLSMLKLYNLLMDSFRNKVNTVSLTQDFVFYDKYKVEDKILLFKEELKNKSKINFADIILRCENKIEVIVSFLAMLEIAKLKNMAIIQMDKFNNIYLERIENNE